MSGISLSIQLLIPFVSRSRTLPWQIFTEAFCHLTSIHLFLNVFQLREISGSSLFPFSSAKGQYHCGLLLSLSTSHVQNPLSHPITTALFSTHYIHIHICVCTRYMYILCIFCLPFIFSVYFYILLSNSCALYVCVCVSIYCCCQHCVFPHCGMNEGMSHLILKEKLHLNYLTYFISFS